MKFKIISGLVITNLTLASSAFADTAATPAQQAQLSSLQNQITQLENGLNDSSSFTNNILMSDSSNPFGAMPDTSFPLALLQSKTTFNKPLVMGGQLEADLQSWGDNTIPGSNPITDNTLNYSNGTSIYLTTAKLFTMANLGDWATTYYSVSAATTVFPTTFDQAFLVLGDLAKNPLYLMIGKGYLPFGSFAGNGPWSNSITTNDFRISQTYQVNLGFFQNGLSLNIADANSGTTYGSEFNDFVYNINYANNYNNINYSLGSSYITDIRGMNGNAGTAYGELPLGVSGGPNGAYDFNGSLGYKEVTLMAEYIATDTSAVNPNGSSTGILRSWMTTLDYSPVVLGKPTTFSIGYSGSQNMQNIPYNFSGMYNQYPLTGPNQGFQSSWIAFVSRPIYTNVILSPEFDYAKTYAGLYTWTSTLDLTAYF